MRYELSEAERAYLDDKGFLVLENALSAAEVAKLVEAVDSVYARFGGEPGTGRLEVRNCVAQGGALLRLLTQPDLLSLIVELLGPNIKLRSSHLDVRPPLVPGSVTNELGRGRMGEPEQWHVDGPLYGYPMVGTLLPLMEVKIGYYLSDVLEPEAGALCVIPGSHKLDYRVLGSEEFRLPTEYVYKVQVPAGSAVLFRTGLWHCVSPNLSEITRKVLYYAYTYRWIQPSDYFQQSQELLASCTPIQRQLLGGTVSDDRAPLGDEPEKTPCSFYWYSEPTDLPLMAWFQQLQAQRKGRRFALSAE
jgi:ectoine hydroxylase-related dioxygenase (phytanoyl-CoA dioxygenase family)